MRPTSSLAGRFEHGCTSNRTTICVNRSGLLERLSTFNLAPMLPRHEYIVAALSRLP
jgi:hypothetical protein